MKAEIVYNRKSAQWTWKIKASNGLLVAWGRYYYRKDNAKRGLERFLHGVYINIFRGNPII